MAVIGLVLAIVVVAVVVVVLAVVVVVVVVVEEEEESDGIDEDITLTSSVFVVFLLHIVLSEEIVLIDSFGKYCSLVKYADMVVMESKHFSPCVQLPSTVVVFVTILALKLYNRVQFSLAPFTIIS